MAKEININNYTIEEVVFLKCPICKKGKVQHFKPKGFLNALTKSEMIICDNCHAQFSQEGEKHDEHLFRLDLSQSNQKNKYDGKALKVSEWERGISDLDQCVKTNTLPTVIVSDLKIILEPNEESHYLTGCRLYEERAVRYSGGGAIRVAKGVYVGGGRSYSEGELNKIDTGTLLLTNKRLIFNGNLRSSVIDLRKIVIVEESGTDDDKNAGYVEIGASNRKKSQIFAVDEPTTWATFIRIAIKKSQEKGNRSKKHQEDEETPEWLEQEEKQPELFRSEDGLSPINILREKAKEYEKKKDYTKAEELYLKIAKMSKSSFDYSTLGRFLRKRGKLKQALAFYQEAIRKEKDVKYQHHDKTAIEQIKKELAKQ